MYTIKRLADNISQLTVVQHAEITNSLFHSEVATSNNALGVVRSVQQIFMRNSAVVDREMRHQVSERSERALRKTQAI